MQDSNFLFVYGTLRKKANRPSHRLLADCARFVGGGSFQGKLYNLGRFAGAVPSERKSDRVFGEIYRLRDPGRTFELLDHYEGKLFRRELRAIHLYGGRTIESWIYLYTGPKNSTPVIRGGNYVMFQSAPTNTVRVRRISTRADLEKAFAIRMRVFVEEQDVPREIELDRDDQRAIHFLATRSTKPVGTARVVMRRSAAKIGRMAVLKSYRGEGVGTKLLRHAVATARQLGARKIYLHAQLPVIGFYERAGFCCVGPVFDEADIPHRKMILRVRKKI